MIKRIGILQTINKVEFWDGKSREIFTKQCKQHLGILGNV